MAQTASEITPDSFSPPMQRLNGAVVFTGQPGTEAPEGADQIGITLSGVVLEDALPQMARANEAFRRRLTRGRIPVSELFEATADLEAAYAEAGFVLARVVLPQQSLSDGGQLRVVVVNGYVEQIDITQVPAPIRPRIEALTSGLVDRPGLTRAELERRLLLAGDVPGTALRSALASGTAPGATVVSLDPEYRQVTGFVGISNASSDELGRVSLDAGVDSNSVFGLGETLYARVSGAPEGLLTDTPRSRVLAFGGVMPVGLSGATVNLEFTFSDTSPDNPDAPTQSEFSRQSLRFLYPFVRGRQFNLSGQIALDLQQDSQSLVDGAEIYSDELAVLRGMLTTTYLHDDNAFTTGGLVLSQGLDAFGARTREDAEGDTPLSRSGADATFTKLTGSFSHGRALSERVSLSVVGRFQTSFGDPLPTSEQFGLVGPSELSTFESGAIKGDSGWLLRSEVSTRFDTNAVGFPLRVSPYVFLAGGMARLHQPTAVEEDTTTAISYGIGADLFTVTGSNFRSSSMRIEFGRGEVNDADRDENRFSIAAMHRF